MASNYDSYYANRTEHVAVMATQLLATTYGKHNFNVLPTEDIDNGVIVKLGDWAGDDYFEISSDTPTFTGTILQQLNNGGWLILVTETADDTVLVYNPELIYPETTTEMQEPSEYYNAADEITRAYGIAVYDKFAVTEVAFDGTPAAGSTVTVDASTHKYVVATA